MPELPDLVLYVEALENRLLGRTLDAVRLASPFLLRSVEPPIDEVVGKRVNGVERLGKRIVIALAWIIHERSSRDAQTHVRSGQAQG